MPEVKNAFIKSKMNKDLDARLLPSGEYRDAMNISISTSEGSDVGAVENIKGNEKLLDLNTLESVTGLNVIGYYSDEVNNYIYIFSTDQDVSVNTEVASNANCFLHEYHCSTGTTVKKLEGAFLNFSKQSFITGVNLLENLLFFTDNRNQPRVINVEKSYTYYTNEDHISVAKFAPFKAINLLDEHTDTVASTPSPGSIIITTGGTNVVQVGDFIISDGDPIGRVDSYTEGTKTVAVDRAHGLTASDPVVFQRSTMINRTLEHLDNYNKGTGSIDNPNYDNTWEGDSDFLEDKFIRFSYRFKFDDGQYSLMAPFTQPIFIPKQFGYMVGDDEDQTYKTSVVNFFENIVQEVGLKIPLPSNTEGESSWESNRFKISEIDILYKESDKLAVKVVNTVASKNILSADIVGEDNLYTYNYTSKKPYKTLPNKDVVRVFDKVPVKSQGQEIISNRVVYANYKDKNSPPDQLPDYFIQIGNKQYEDFSNTAQYPLHSLKQNRTYQVGIILSDRYGRSTSVLLSKKDSLTTGAGSTVFSSYKSDNEFSASNTLEDWNGDTLKFTLDSPIETTASSDGAYPGFFADSDNNNKSWDITGLATVTKTSSSPYTYTVTGDITSSAAAGDYLRGKYIDYTKITSSTYTSPNTVIITEEEISDTYIEEVSGAALNLREAYTINKLGWYSYKIVVKQTEQEYYNVYLPLVINGGFESISGTGGSGNDEEDELAQAVLINDNINKVPRDLSEVGPDQKQYGSSVKLFGRVTPSRLSTATTNEQWYPNISGDQVGKIATVLDSGYILETSAGVQDPIAGMYESLSNPLIAYISSLAPSGSTETFGRLPNGTTALTQNLSIYEANPTISLLDIFWETSTTGLLSDINLDAANQYDGPTGVGDNYSFSLPENETSFPNDCTSNFNFANSSGNIVTGTILATLTSVTDGFGNTLSPNPFSLVSVGSYQFKIQASNTFTFLHDSSTRHTFTFTFDVDYTTGSDTYNNTITATGSLDNIAPTVDDPGTLQKLDSDTTMYNFGTNSTNGSSISAENLDDVKFSLTGTGSSNFSINSSTGLLEKVNTGLDGNTYTLTVRLQDAISGSTADAESLTDSVTFDLEIGAQAVNWTTGLYDSVNCDTGGEGFVYFWGTGSPTSGVYPSSFNSSSPTVSTESTSAHTLGEVEFKIETTPPPSAACSTSYTGYTTKWWVQRRLTTTSTWTTIHGGSSGETVSSGLPGFKVSNSSPSNSAQSTSPYYEYRVLVNGFDSSRCSAGCGDGSTFEQFKLYVVDTNYP